MEDVLDIALGKDNLDRKRAELESSLAAEAASASEDKDEDAVASLV